MVNTILDLAAARVASAWLSDVPAGEYVAPFVASGISAMFMKLHEVSAFGSGRDPERWTRQLFAIPERLNTQEQAADLIASLILNWLPEDVRTCGAAIAKEKDKPPAGSAHEGSSSSTGPVDFESLFADLQSSPKFQEIKNLLGEVSKISATWTPDQVDKLLRRLTRRFVRRTPHIQRYLDDVKKELISFPRRFEVATVLASSELAVPMLRSTPDIGRIVHRELQDLYISLFKSPMYRHRIVAERMVYRPGQPDTNLEIAAREELPTDRTLQVLVWSRLSPFSSRGQLRDDLVDLSSALDWQIKPVGSAHEGVTQETLYRMLYNFCATVLVVLGQSVKMEHLMAGKDWNDFAAPLLKPIGGPGWTAKPFCLDFLPGLVLYFVIRGLSPKELAALEAIIIAILLAYLKRLAEKLRPLGEAVARVAKAVEELIQVLERIAQAITQLLLVLLIGLAMIVAVFLFYKALVAAAGALAAAAALILVVGGTIVFLLPKDAEAQPSAEVGTTTAGKSNEHATVSFGHCTVINFPVGQFPKLVETMSRLYQQGLKAAFAELSKFRFTEFSQGTV